MKKHFLTAGLVAALLLTALTGCAPKAEEPAETETPKIQYATEGVTAVDDPDALQKAVDEMVEEGKDSGVALEYRNDASSTDGETFACYIANAAGNKYDMFINIYADAELTDELYLSGLVRPGQAFESIQLSKKLEKGTHTVYTAFTQVKEDLDTIHAQVMVTMVFTVE